jgi:hypothetical protein
MSMPAIVNVRPVAWMPAKAPTCVPAFVQRTTTRSPLGDQVFDGEVRCETCGDHRESVYCPFSAGSLSGERIMLLVVRSDKVGNLLNSSFVD